MIKINDLLLFRMLWQNLKSHFKITLRLKIMKIITSMYWELLKIPLLKMFNFTFFSSFAKVRFSAIELRILSEKCQNLFLTQVWKRSYFYQLGSEWHSRSGANVLLSWNKKQPIHLCMLREAAFFTKVWVMCVIWKISYQ